MTTRATLPSLLAGLALAATLTACGGGPEAVVDEAPAEPTVAEPAATPEPPTLEPTEAPTEAPTEVPTEAVTETPTEAPTPVPPTALAVTAAPTEPPAPTAEPSPEWFVELYPDNWVSRLPEDQLCVGINWRSAGVTDLVFGREGFGSEPVEAEGRKGDICFPEKDADFWLEYRRPDGQVERKTLYIDREK